MDSEQGEMAPGTGFLLSSTLAPGFCQEFIGKHFPDAPGEEDCTKARPVKAMLR